MGAKWHSNRNVKSTGSWGRLFISFRRCGFRKSVPFSGLTMTKDFQLGSVFVFKRWNTVGPIVVSHVDRSPLPRSITLCWPMYKLMKYGILIYISASFLTVFREWKTTQGATRITITVRPSNEGAERGANTIENKLDRRVFTDLLRKMIPDMQLMYPDEEGFPLEHADLGTHNIFVDTDFNITCIIDWALCSTVPLPTLLTHPPLPSRSYVLGMPEQQAFEQAFEKAFEQAFEEKDPNHQLTRLLRSSHERWDFDRFLHKDAQVEDYRGFQRLFEWKLGTRNMRDYFAKRKERNFLQLRRKLINLG